jgi:hypothetical protein
MDVLCRRDHKDQSTDGDRSRQKIAHRKRLRDEFLDKPRAVLVGVEQGVEGEHKLSGIGSAGRNLQVRTEYTPLPPEVSTGAASEVQSTQAKLNGTVNPKGTNTHYYFQYGTTTSYGSSTPEGDAGSGLSSVPESASITGLEPGTTYYYRFVASSSAGTSYGAD